jgi:ubiquinone/menaquinone biosynthesis C-methylase UbiE
MDRLLEATFLAEQHHFWFNGFRRFVGPLLDRASRGRRDLELLDCGCGTGANLTMLERYGRATGVDLTMRGLEFARGYGKRRVARASVTHLPFPDTMFDVVTSFDVLYALADPQETLALSEMRRVLKPGGAAVINVAAFEMLRGNHSILGGELRRYSRGELREHVARAGFAVERITYTNATTFPLVLGVRLAQRAAGFAANPEEATREITIPSAPINTALSALLAVEAAVARHVNLPFGSSLLCLAWKR